MSKLEFTIVPPKMPWDMPIENEILQFVRTMALDMEMQARHNIWRNTRKGAQAYADAYRTVEKHIVREIEFRKSIEAES